MRRFDRVIGILLMLQTRRVVKAQDIATQYGVSLRTVYRDIRSLETAGVPIGAEAGIGYYLAKGYHLPPVVFSDDEAAALIIGEKFISQSASGPVSTAYQSALNKVRAVLKSDGKESVDRLGRGIEVLSGTDTQVPWLRECQEIISKSLLSTFRYSSASSSDPVERTVEAIGLYHASGSWHLIAWCQLRQDYRDFRLDRIEQLQVSDKKFKRRDRSTLQEYLKTRRNEPLLTPVRLGVEPSLALYVKEMLHLHGKVSESQEKDEVLLEFMSPSLESMSHWILFFAGRIKVYEPPELREKLDIHCRQLVSVYLREPQRKKPRPKAVVK